MKGRAVTSHRSEGRETEVGAADESSLAEGGPEADGEESVEAGRGGAAAVVGLGLRCALSTRPSGSQGSAPVNTHKKSKNKQPKKERQNTNTRKGHF